MQLGAQFLLHVKSVRFRLTGDYVGSLVFYFLCIDD